MPRAAQAADAGAALSCQPSPRRFPELKAWSLGGFIAVEMLLLQAFPRNTASKINSEPFGTALVNQTERVKAGKRRLGETFRE